MRAIGMEEGERFVWDPPDNPTGRPWNIVEFRISRDMFNA